MDTADIDEQNTPKTGGASGLLVQHLIPDSEEHPDLDAQELSEAQQFVVSLPAEHQQGVAAADEAPSHEAVFQEAHEPRRTPEGSETKALAVIATTGRVEAMTSSNRGLPRWGGTGRAVPRKGVVPKPVEIAIQGRHHRILMDKGFEKLGEPLEGTLRGVVISVDPLQRAV